MAVAQHAQHVLAGAAGFRSFPSQRRPLGRPHDMQGNVQSWSHGTGATCQRPQAGQKSGRTAVGSDGIGDLREEIGDYRLRPLWLAYEKIALHLGLFDATAGDVKKRLVDFDTDEWNAQ